MVETPGRPLSPLTEAGGLVVGSVIAHLIYSYTVDMPPPPSPPLFLPFPLFIPVPITPLTLTPIPYLRPPSPHRCSLGVRPTTRSHSTGDKYDCHGIKWFEYHYGLKQSINGPHPFRKWLLRTNIGSHTTTVCK